MKTIIIAALLVTPLAWADSSPIDCAAPKPAVQQKRKAKPVPLRIKPIVSEELCPTPLPAVKPEPAGPTVVAAEEPPASTIDQGPTFPGLVAASPEEAAAPTQHITYVHDLVPGGILPVPVYLTTHEVQTIYVDRFMPADTTALPPSFDVPAPAAGVISPVQEPETWAMMLGGLALLGFVARRKGRAS